MQCTVNIRLLLCPGLKDTQESLSYANSYVKESDHRYAWILMAYSFLSCPKSFVLFLFSSLKYIPLLMFILLWYAWTLGKKVWLEGFLNISSTKGLISESHWNLGKLLKHSSQEFVSIIQSLTIVDRKAIKSTGGLNYFLSVIDHCAQCTMIVIHLYFFSIWQ